MDISNYHLESFVSHFNLLKTWCTKEVYCPIELLSIGTLFRPGPGRNGNTVGTDRAYDEYLLYALLDEPLDTVFRQIDFAEPSSSDCAFWKEALDWFELGTLFDDSDLCYLYCSFILSSHNDKELLDEINKLEQYFQNQCPNNSLNFMKPSSSGPCYVATAVYGSYDCPEVWTLRRFRDYQLDKTRPGQLFIRCYYAVSPTLVRYFGTKSIIVGFFRKLLDRFVLHLKKKGFKDTPYQD